MRLPLLVVSPDDPVAYYGTGCEAALVPTNLPTPLTSFLGREPELARSAALLHDARLLSLTGPGGCGKTRLALHLVTEQAEHFPDGVWFVDLAAVAEGDFVLGEVAMAVGVEEPER